MLESACEDRRPFGPGSLAGKNFSSNKPKKEQNYI
jgi:hypothetical protein